MSTFITTLTTNPEAMILFFIWVMPWKGLALWKAARRADKWWFIALLLVQTFAILDILYIYIFSRNKKENL